MSSVKVRNPAARRWAAPELARLVCVRPAPPVTSVEGAPTFAHWWGEWQRSGAGRAALAQFDRVRPAESFADERAASEAFAALAAMADAGFFAATFPRQGDPGEMHRERIRAGRARVGDLAAAARELGRGVRADYPGLEAALAEAAIAAGVGANGVDRRRLSALWGRFFDELAAALAGPLPDLHGGPFMLHFTAGNLHFERPKVTGRPLDVVTMLAFELVFHARRWAAGRLADAWQAGQRMPADPVPAGGYELAAEWAAACLGVACTAEQVRQRLRSLPADVGLMPWPHEAPR